MSKINLKNYFDAFPSKKNFVTQLLPLFQTITKELSNNNYSPLAVVAY
jgi:hypothetical protein